MLKSQILQISKSHKIHRHRPHQPPSRIPTVSNPHIRPIQNKPTFPVVCKMASLTTTTTDTTTSFDLSTDGKREMLDLTRATTLLDKMDTANLTHMRLSNKSFGDEAALVLAPKLLECKQLAVADLSDIIAGRMTAVGLSVLNTISQALSQCSTLTEVDLSENALGPRGIAACRPLLSSVESLKRLTFNNDGLSAEAMNEIRDLLLFRGSDQPTVLEKLHFWNNMSGDGGASAIASVVSLSPNLIDFRLSSTRCGSEGGTDLLQALSTRSTLQHLDLSDNTFGASTAPLLGPLVNNNFNLIVLNLADLSLENEGVVAVLASLSTTGVRKALKILDLSFSGVVDGHQVLKHFPAMVSNCPELTTFGFEENEIGSRGALRIARGLLKSTKLIHLNLKMCDIHDIGAVAVAKAYATRSSGSLEMNGNMLSSNMMKEMNTMFQDNHDLGSWSDNDEDGADDEEDGDGVWLEDVAEEEKNSTDDSSVDVLSELVDEMKVV